MREYLFTSESVAAGHPDKVCDQVSDAILDTILHFDKNARVACEVAISKDVLFIAGEITTTMDISDADIAEVARATIFNIGYDGTNGFDPINCAVDVVIHQQSPDIAQGVNVGEGMFAPQGAGDQGMMFGYASDETAEYMPLAIVLAHQLTREMDKLRREGGTGLRPDGKSQVTVKYKQGIPIAVTDVVLAMQHDEDVSKEQLEALALDIIKKTDVPKWLTDMSRLLVNPTGRFVIGGPTGDAGLTGRKIIVDTYGGMGRHGGGAFSGKDPSKVDRSATYMARYIAKHVVAARLAHKCEVQLAYIIGVEEPVSIYVNTFGTNYVGDEEIEEAIRKVFDLTPQGIIQELELKNPIYNQTATYGHFGRLDLDLPWERLDDNIISILRSTSWKRDEEQVNINYSDGTN